MLSGCALSALVAFDYKYFLERVIPELITQSSNSIVTTRAGAIAAVGEVLLGLNGKGHLNTSLDHVQSSSYKHTQLYYEIQNKGHNLQDPSLLKIV